MSHNVLAEATTLGSVTLRNRTVLAPMTRVTALHDGTLTQRNVDYYRTFAQGGFAALITESVFIDDTYSPGYKNQPGLVTAAHAESWKTVTDEVHAHGAVIIAQLMHAGPQTQGDVFGFSALGPTTTQSPSEQLAMYGKSGPYPVPDAATTDQLAEVTHAFVSAALRAKEAGFDGVEIHAANGYLLDAFLTDYLNTRTDEYGGSPAARVKLTIDVARAVREAVGHDFVVGVRVSQAKVSDPFHKWAGGVREAATIFSALGELDIDYVHTSEHYATAPAFDGDERTLAALAKQYSGKTVIANGHLDTAEPAQEVVESGAADLVAIGKAAISNRDWPLRVESGAPIAPPFVVTEWGEWATIKDWELQAPELSVAPVVR